MKSIIKVNTEELLRIRKGLNGKLTKLSKLTGMTVPNISKSLDINGHQSGQVELDENFYYRCCEIANIKPKNVMILGGHNTIFRGGR